MQLTKLILLNIHQRKTMEVEKMLKRVMEINFNLEDETVNSDFVPFHVEMKVVKKVVRMILKASCKREE
jgi:hypothetical protein